MFIYPWLRVASTVEYVLIKNLVEKEKLEYKYELWGKHIL